MNLFKRFNNHSVFYKLIISYAVLVFILTLVLGSISYLYFSSNFNKEVEKVHQKMLEQVSNAINSEIIALVSNTYMNISTAFTDATHFLFLFDDPVKGNHLKIYNTYKYLQEIVTNAPDVIKAVHVYYKDHNLLISSSLGIKYLNEESREPYKNMDWLKLLSQSTQHTLWIESRGVATNIEADKLTHGSNIFTYAKSYPIISNGMNAKGLIAIDVKESAFSDIVQRIMTEEYSDTFIVNNKGEIISHHQKEKLYTMISSEKYMRRMLISTKDYDSTIAKRNNIPSIISFSKLPHLNWKIINVTPLTRFYQQTTIIKRVLIIICFLVIIIGLIIATLFTSNIYNPLEDIMNRVKVLLGSSNSNEPNKENEYAFINHVISDLSTKVNKLENTLQNNKPILKYNLLMELLHQQVLREEELSERLKLIGTTMNYPFYFTLIIELNQKVLHNLTIENSHFVVYDLINKCESFSNDELLCSGIQLPDFQIGIIIGTNKKNMNSISKLASELISYAYANYTISTTIAIGNPVQSLLKVHESFKQAKILLKYKYFLPKIPLLSGEQILARENSNETMPESLLEEFEEGLRLRNLAKLRESLDLLIKLSKEGPYSAAHCHQKILNITNIFSNYIRDMRYTPSQYQKQNLNNIFYEIENIEEFKNWILNFAEEVLNFLRNQKDNKNAEVVELVKKYIYDHVDNELSLDSVAEHISISPKYLSKIFKDETGINFTSFVTDVRIEKAKELLINTDMTIQQIGYVVGYNTPAYFIRQFKAKYGYTPNEYRRIYGTPHSNDV